MRFGLFYEHQLPRPWGPDAERTLLHNALEQIELADRLGFHVAWEVEHHFLEEYSHSSAPEVFLAAVSQRTERIRLGHGIVQLPPAYNHPTRVAERIATLDLLSNGRVDFGTGESSSQMELGGFGVPREEKRAQWEEALEVIVRMLVEEPFAGHDGPHVSVPPRNVLPKPLQRPHPPLWAACSRRETILLAARKGLGALSFSFVEPEEAREWVDAYERIIVSEECVPAGFDLNPNIAVVVPLMCHQDEETAIDRGIDGAHFFGYSLAHYYVFGQHRPGRTNVWEEFEQHRAEFGFAREIVSAHGGPVGIRLFEAGLGSLRGAIGTPGQIAELLERYERAGVDQVVFVAQAGPNRHEHVCESLELFAKEVLPRFADRAEATETKKRARLAEAAERALARRPPARVARADYTVTPQGEPAPARRRELAPRRGRPIASVAEPGQVWRERLLAAVTRNRSDEQLDRLFGSAIGTRLLLTGMAKAYDPERAAGFRGTIQYELSSRRGLHRWYVVADGKRATARPGVALDPVVTIRADVPTFVRVAARELHGAQAALEGKMRIEGDLRVAVRLTEMFGGSTPY